MERMNFSWLIEGVIAGHGRPMSEEDLLYLKQKGIKTLVRMVEEYKVRVTPEQIKAMGFRDHHEPVPDFTAPEPEQIDRMINYIKESIAQNMPVAVSCGAGIGRTGTILACYLVSKGWAAEAAMEEVRQRRGTSIETEEQKEAVRAYAKRTRKILAERS